MNLKYFLVSLFFVLICSKGIGQDNTFTQFFSSPLTLNPALSGNYKGNYRFYVINRNQWKNIIDNNLRSYAGSFDLKFDLKNSYKSKNYLGFGFVFYHDEAGLFEYSTNNMVISAAFHKGIDPKKNHYISIGYNIGRTQKNINFNELNFEDSFNLSNAYSIPTSEQFNSNNFSFWDSTIGINYSIAPSSKSQLNAGLSVFHLFRPNVTFYKNDDDPVEDLLKRRYLGYINYQFPIGNYGKYILSPRFVGSIMGVSYQTKIGANLRVLVNEHKKMAMHLGSWVNVVGDTKNPLSTEAIVALLGIEFKGMLLGLSYDFGLTKLGSGAFEISIGYLGEYTTDDHDCPKF